MTETNFFLKYKDTAIKIPVLPSEIMITHPSNNQTENILSSGDITIIKEVKQGEITIESFFPYYPDWYVKTKDDFLDNVFYVRYIDQIILDKNPVRFIATGINWNVLMSIENFEHGYEGCSKDIKYTLTLKQYRAYGIEVINTSTSEQTPFSSLSNNPQNTSLTNFMINDVVFVNGRYFQDTNGKIYIGTLKNIKCKIIHIDTRNTIVYKYKVAYLDNRPIGWINKESLSK